jgi:hypothetical protein
MKSGKPAEGKIAEEKSHARFRGWMASEDPKCELNRQQNRGSVLAFPRIAGKNGVDAMRRGTSFAARS